MSAEKTVVLSSDHAAIDMRRAVAAHLEAAGWSVSDIGPQTTESTDYPKHGRAAAEVVAAGDARFGIVLCGSGQGIMMAANKVAGVRCGVCAEPVSARLIRQHNDANMLSIGARLVGEGMALEIVDAFVSTAFEGGRHARRVDMSDGQVPHKDP